jgi:hypothetical protein
MDMTASIEARSDQINAADLVSGPRTYTIEKVVKGVATGPFDFHLVESPGKVYRPNLGMRRVIVEGWGPETSTYVGRRLTLFNEPTVVWAGAEIGGIRISAMSHLDKPLKTALAISQKKKVPYIVQPLDDAIQGEPSEHPAPPEPTAKEVAACNDPAVLREWWKQSGPDMRAVIQQRVAELDANPETPDPADELPIGGGGK